MSEEEKKAKKQAAKKPAKKEGAASGKPTRQAAEKPAPRAPEPEEKVEEKPPAEEEQPVAAEAEAPEGEEEEMSEEELRKLIEEQMEKITVKEIVGRMMMDLASLGYQKMGLPESANLKYRDFDQARMAIDSLKGLLGALEGKVPDGEIAPYRSTLANLQMNFVRLAKPGE